MQRKLKDKEDSFATYVGVGKVKEAAAAGGAAPAAGKNTCAVCAKTVYLTEKIEADNKAYHKTCFRYCSDHHRIVAFLYLVSLLLYICIHPFSSRSHLLVADVLANFINRCAHCNNIIKLGNFAALNGTGEGEGEGEGEERAAY